MHKPKRIRAFLIRKLPENGAGVYPTASLANHLNSGAPNSGDERTGSWDERSEVSTVMWCGGLVTPAQPRPSSAVVRPMFLDGRPLWPRALIASQYSFVPIVL